MPSLLEGFGRLLKILLGLVGAMVLAVVAVVVPVYYYYARDLPKLDKITDYHPPVVSELFADDGTKIGEFWEECRYLLPYDKIPPLIIEAFVASEDSRFWEHRGIDLRSIARAFIENLRSGKVVQGGSTITQQVTRSLVLSHERSLARKVKEAIVATQIERNLSKKQILYLYLNQIFLGNRSHGVEAAARNYFHKSVGDLDLAEISMIAGLPSAPSQYSPIVNPTMAKERQRHVLERMVEMDYISQKAAAEAYARPLKVYRAGIDKDFNNRFAPFFVEHVRRMLEERYGADVLYRGGLKIETTASVAANRAAQRAVQKGLREVDRLKGFRGPIGTVPADKVQEFAHQIDQEILFDRGEDALLIPPSKEREETRLEPDTLYKAVITGLDEQGNPEILVGLERGTILPPDRARAAGRKFRRGEVYWVRLKEGSSFILDQEPQLEGALFSYDTMTGEVKALVGGYSAQRSEFDRATQAMRQPGSAFKPVVYAAALDKGYRPGTVVVDSPVVYQVGRDEFWSPKNYGDKFNGPMTVRAALAHSVNVIAVKVFHDIGINYAVAYARKLGIVSPIQKYLSSALGASDLTLQELTRAYGTFPRGGIRPDLIFIRKITDLEGNVLEENRPQPLDPAKVFEPAEEKEVDSLNPDLIAEGEKVIKQEKLRLTTDEQKILYGSVIPKGHVMTPQTAFLMVNLMRGVVEGGTGWKAKALGRPAAGKTGTTNDESDAWFIGYTPDHIAGVWLGYDSRKPIGPKLTGGVISAPIWLTYMQEYLKDRPILDFPVPSSINIAEIDSLSGGSSVVAMKAPPEEEIPAYEPGKVPASRGVDFLFEDLKKL